VSVSEERLRVYARITAEIAAGTAPSHALAEAGLTAEELDALERAVEAEVSRALDAGGAGPPGGPSLPTWLVTYERVMREEQARALGPSPLRPADLARAVAALASGEKDPAVALAKVGLRLPDVVRAAVALGPSLAKDPAAAAAFARVVSGPRKG
jgi:hypothetical protein